MSVPIHLAPEAAADVLRTLLDTLTHPARSGHVDRGLAPRAPRSIVLAATLVDEGVAVAVVGDDEAAHGLAVGTGARLTSDLASADVIVAPHGIDRSVLSTLRRGSALVPEDGARLVVGAERVRTVEPGGTPAAQEATEVWVAGPGAGRGRRFAVLGVEVEWFDELAAVNAAPLVGIDTWIVDPTGTLIAIPRAVSIEVVAHPADAPRRSRRRRGRRTDGSTGRVPDPASGTDPRTGHETTDAAPDRVVERSERG